MPALPQDAEPIFKDGQPGWIVGYDSTIADGDFADILLEDGRETYVRLPDYGRRITPRVDEPQAQRIAADYNFNTAGIRAAYDRWHTGCFSREPFAPTRARQLLRALDIAIERQGALAEAAE